MQANRKYRAFHGPMLISWAVLILYPLLNLPVLGQGKQARRDTNAREEDSRVKYSPPLSQADHKVFATLRQDIDLAADAMPLRAFAAMLAKRTGLKVTVDAKIDATTCVDIHCKAMALESALRAALSELGLDYRVTRGRLDFERQSSGDLATRTYSVADLCATEESFDALVDEVRSLSHESEWEDMGGWAKITPNPPSASSTLVHRQSEQEHVLRLLVNKRSAAKKKPAAK